jgi:hypothetical protein
MGIFCLIALMLWAKLVSVSSGFIQWYANPSESAVAVGCKLPPVQLGLHLDSTIVAQVVTEPENYNKSVAGKEVTL